MLCRVPLGGGLRCGRGAALLFFGGRVAKPVQFDREFINRFKLIRRHEAIPGWAWPFEPPIPLVGQHFELGRGVLVYASAENLRWLHREAVPARFTSDDAWNRYRVRYEQAGQPGDGFFPDVGIQPVSDGGLMCAALFAAQRLDLPQADAPRTFLQQIAVTNWGKFSIRSEDRNRDYAYDPRKLVESLAYVVTELTLLQPALALVPDTIWRHRMVRQAMRGASPSTLYAPLPQFNATVINCHLVELSKAGRRLASEFTRSPLATWMQHLRRINHEDAWRYLARVDQALSACDGLNTASA